MLPPAALRVKETGPPVRTGVMVRYAFVARAWPQAGSRDEGLIEERVSRRLHGRLALGHVRLAVGGIGLVFRERSRWDAGIAEALKE